MSRFPAILITLTAALAVVFLSVWAWEARNVETPIHRVSVTAPSIEAPRSLSRDESRLYNSLPQNTGQQQKAVRLLFFGDLMLDRHVGERIAANGLGHLLAGLMSTTSSNNVETTHWGVSGDGTADGDAPLGRLYGKKFDIVMANLEGAVTDGGAHYPPVNAYDFAFSPDLIGQLKPYGFNFFNLANNHLTDQGEAGVAQTYRNLDGLGIAYSGCPDTKTGDCTARIMEINGKRIAFLGFSQVYGALDRDEVLKQVASSSESADLTVVNIHWGREYEHNFLSNQQELGRALVDAGADMIIGHHPHVVQGMEVYRNKPIFYSLGNFVFDQYFSPATQEGLAVEAVVDDEGMELFLHPLRSKSSVVTEMEGEERESFIKKFAGWSTPNIQYPISNNNLDIRY